MNNNVKIFESPQFGQVRTAGDAENPFFCLADVCKALSLSAKGVNQRLSDEVISNYPITDKLGRTQNALFVNEDGLYDVILDSRKPEAKAFRKWITSEVLPSIRKSGGYITAQQNESPEAIMAKALRIADETLQRREQQLQMLQSENEELHKENVKIAPMAEYTKEVLQSNTTYTLTQVSKDLEFRSVYAFLDWAKDREILYRQSGQWMPNSKYSDKGYFKTRTAKFVKSDNTVGTSMSTVVTEAGRMWLHGLLEKEQQRKGGAL
jgi:prophage antirepressor-like protein